MAYNSNSRQSARTDRFGNSYVLKTAYQVTNKKTGEMIDAFKCTFEIGGKLYRLEVSPRQKEHKGDGEAMWAKLTKLNPRQRSSGGF